MPLTIYLQLGAVIALIALCVLALLRHSLPLTLYLPALCFTALLATGGYLLEMLTTHAGLALWARIIYCVALPYFAPLFYLFCRNVLGRTLRAQPMQAWLLAPPTLLAVLFGLELHTLSLANIHTSAALQLQTLYSVVMVICTIVLLLREAVHQRWVSRRLSLSLLVGVCLPWAGGLAYIPGFTGSFNSTTALLPLPCLVACLYTLNQRRLNWLPYARDQIIWKSQTAYLLLDTKGRYVECNEAMRGMFPAIVDAKQGSRLAGLAGLPALPQPLHRQTLELTVAETGMPRELRTQIIPIAYHGGRVATCVLFRDVTQQKLLQARLASADTQDDLTGLYNQEHFMRYAAHEYETMRRLNASAAVLVLQIDGGQGIASHYGPLCGDKLLALTAGLLVAALQPTDIAGVCGQHRLAVFLPGEGRDSSWQLAQQLLATVAATPRQWNGEEIPLTASVGLAVLDNARHTNFAQLFEDASAALFTAQGLGGGQAFLGGPHRSAS